MRVCQGQSLLAHHFDTNNTIQAGPTLETVNKYAVTSQERLSTKLFAYSQALPDFFSPHG